MFFILVLAISSLELNYYSALLRLATSTAIVDQILAFMIAPSTTNTDRNQV